MEERRARGLAGKIKERISERNRSKIAARIEDPLIRLQYADVMDLHQIVDKHWDIFKERFEPSIHTS